MALVLVAIVATPIALFAHAHLVRSTPSANATVESPIALSLWFSERPELRFSTLQLLDSAGAAVALGPIAAIAGDGMGITAPITGSLSAGRYTVKWQTAAADGHSTNGKFTFTATVKQAAAAPAAPVPQQPPPVIHHVVPANAVVTSAANAGVSTGLRWMEYVGVLVLVGAVVFRLVVLRNSSLPQAITADAADRARRLGSSSLLLFIIATITRLAEQSKLIPGPGSRMDSMMTVVRDTGWGHAWLIGACGAVLCVIGLATARRIVAGWGAVTIGVIAIAGSEALTGHAGASVRRLPLAVSVDVAHLLGAGAWLGGLTLVVLAGLPSLRPLAETERARAGSRIVRAYHSTAVESVAIVLLTAAIAAWLRLGSLDALLGTAYGNMLLRKIVFVVIVLGFGLYHRRAVVVPEWTHKTSLSFRRSAVGELLVGLVVVAFTALLVGTALPMQ